MPAAHVCKPPCPEQGSACVRSVVFELFGRICIQAKDRAILIRSMHENVGSWKLSPII